MRIILMFMIPNTITTKSVIMPLEKDGCPKTNAWQNSVGFTVLRRLWTALIGSCICLQHSCTSMKLIKWDIKIYVCLVFWAVGDLRIPTRSKRLKTVSL
ncbi:hypothetical protein RRG08_040112 [Elysia crispata]|uniref:Uncharacterized protein n=1 Tax=Elysia crispata TaxID=231223 RepID=A0AAE1CNE8_9GAST|nr:hypothetical protein RRG08_040112 [Elysia crispata]